MNPRRIELAAVVATRPRHSSLPLVGLLLVLAPWPSAAAPRRSTVETNQPFELRLTQKNVGKPIFVVTSDGNRFTAARLVDDDRSPMVVDFAVACRDGFTDPFTGAVTSDGRLTEVRLRSDGWSAELPPVEEWDSFFELFVNALDTTGVKGELNLLAQGPDASHVRSALNAFEPAVIEACNAALERKMSQGYSRGSALATVGSIDPLPQIAPAVLGSRLWARCDSRVFSVDEFDEEGNATYVDRWGQAQTNTLGLQLPVLCKSPFAPAQPGASDLSQGFAVQGIELAPERNPYRGECPLTVRLSGEVKLTGSGRLRYRYETGSGGLGAPVTVEVTNGAVPVPLSLSIEVGRQPSGPGWTTPPTGSPTPGDTLTVPGPGGDPAGPTLGSARPPTPPRQAGSGLASPTAPGEITDWVRLQVLEPTAGVRASRQVFYKAICQRTPTAGSGLTTPPARRPGRLTTRPAPPVHPPAPGARLTGPGGGTAAPPPAGVVRARPTATPSAANTPAPPARPATAALARPAAAAPGGYELGGFAGRVRVGVELEPAGLQALRQPGGPGVLSVWITTGFFEVVERQPRLPRAELRRAGDGEPRAVLLGVELVRSEPSGVPTRSDRRRYLVRYQRLELPGRVH